MVLMPWACAHPRTCEVEVGIPGDQKHPLLHIEFNASMGYMRDHFKD